MKKRFITVLMVMVIGLFISCSDDSSTNTNNEDGDLPENLLPLKVGNWWLWETTLGEDDFSDGNGNDCALSDSLVVDLRVYYRESSGWSHYGISYANSFRNGTNGVYGYATTHSQEYLLYKYPCDIGDSWSTIFDYEVKLTGKNVSISTDSETYKCWKYELSRDYDRMVLYVAPGIGLIKVEYYDSEGNLDKAAELKDYSIE